MDAITRVDGGARSAASSFSFDFLSARSARLPESVCGTLQNCPKRVGWVATAIARESTGFDGVVESVETTVQYGTAVFDSRGRGFLGFAKRRETTEGLEQETSIDTTAKVSLPSGGHVFPTNTSVVTTVMTPSGATVASTTSTRTISAGRTNFRVSRVSGSTVNTESGIETSRTARQVDLDFYGNELKSETRWLTPSLSEFSAVVDESSGVNEFDETLWLINRYPRAPNRFGHCVSA